MFYVTVYIIRQCVIFFSNNRKLNFLVKYLVVIKISCIFVLYKRGVIPCGSFICSSEFPNLRDNLITLIILIMNLTKLIITIIVCAFGALSFADTYNELAGVFAVVAIFLMLIILYVAFFYHKRRKR